MIINDVGRGQKVTTSSTRPHPFLPSDLWPARMLLTDDGATGTWSPIYKPLQRMCQKRTTQKIQFLGSTHCHRYCGIESHVSAQRRLMLWLCWSDVHPYSLQSHVFLAVINSGVWVAWMTAHSSKCELDAWFNGWRRVTLVRQLSMAHSCTLLRCASTELSAVTHRTI